MEETVEGGKVWFSQGVTINLGNFESVKFDCGIVLPIESEDEAKDAFERCVRFVRSRVREQKKRLSR